MPSTPPPGPVVWRASGPPLLARVVALAVVGYLAVSGLTRLLAPARSRSGGDVLLVAGYLLLLALAVGALVVTLRTRVRLLPEGVEVRELGTQLHPWAQVTGVRADSATRPRTPVLELAGGRGRALPVPSGALRRTGDTTVTDAVLLLRRHLERHRPPIG